ncbi:radical SAM protein [bacterium]|nr:radical SAM protein [candidate division CSSED10-310 bacterium]
MNRISKVRRLGSIFSSYKSGGIFLPYPPLRLWIESTNQCNLRCRVCPNATDFDSPRGNMDMTLYRDIIRQLEHRANDLNLSHRGEPLFHPQLEEMIILARHAGMGSRIHTNATKLDENRMRSLLDAGPDLLSFSFDGFDKETYESVRIGGVFEETLANIERLLAEKKQRGNVRPYTIIQIIQPEDADEDYLEKLRAFGRRFESAGLDKFYIKKPHNWAGNAPGDIPAGTGFIPCTFLYYSLTVLWDGTVCPCPQDWYATMPLGNLRHQSIKEIWNGQPLWDLRKRMQRRDLDGLICASCDRVFRPAVMGIPTENIKAFFGETLAGYNLVRKLIRK